MRRRAFGSRKFERLVEENQKKKESENESLKKINQNLLSFCMDMVDSDLENIFLRHANEMMMIFIESTLTMRPIDEQCESFYNITRQKIHENVELEKAIAKADEVKFLLENQLEQNDFFEKGRLFDVMSIFTKDHEVKYSKCESALRERVCQSGEITISRSTSSSTGLSLKKDSKMYDWESVFKKYDQFIEEHRASATRIKSDFDKTILQKCSWFDYKYLVAENQRLVDKVNCLKSKFSDLKFKFNVAEYSGSDSEEDLDDPEVVPEPKAAEPEVDSASKEFLQKVYSEKSKFKFRSLLNNNVEKIKLIDRDQIDETLRQVFDDYLKKLNA